ncbi:NADPH:quinone oxidoreductase-like isoform X1 [Carya illinoinensis]|uniref:NADPH:quinone oxidoreductase-like isoform X1 n=1 Tax=Carya illinoinensis TaxID=32201 RepID=UPI001C727109|nr:NADPH:quinone oxidoreductase-like isoform X1 [Carya illinoinensis]
MSEVKRGRKMEDQEEAKPVVRVAAISGSLRKRSNHRGLIRAAIQLCEDSIEGMQIEHIEIEQLPMLNTDLEDNGTYPPVVEAFRQKIKEADCVLFASPEYNFSLSAPLKNAVDWASRPPNVWADKPAAIISTGGNAGGERAHYHLRQVGVFLNLHFINKPLFCINAFQPPTKFDKDGNLINEEVKEKLKQVLLALHAFTLRLQAGMQLILFATSFHNHLQSKEKVSYNLSRN